jgi:sterol desaturase/sphingolipid hydroxylase (fatty acid hydroxylase superfamily)
VHAEGRNKNKKCMLVIRPSVYTSCFYSFLQHVLLVFIPSFNMLKEGIKTRSAYWRKEYKQEVQVEGRNKNKKYTQKDGLKKLVVLVFFSFLQHVLLVFIPSFSMYFLFLIRPSVYTSYIYFFLQLVLLVFIPSFSMYFFFLFLKNKKCMLKEGIKTRSACWRKE